MKKNYIFLVLLFLVIATFSFCTGEITSSGNNITVNNAKDLLKAIKSDVTIHLKGGDYLIDSVDIESLGNSNLKRDDLGCLIAENVNNLTIIGEGKVQLVIETPNIPVLTFLGCNNLLIRNIIAGHITEADYCMGCVLAFEECKNVTVEKCDLFGSGLFGFSFYNSSNLLFNESIVRGCSDGIFMVQLSNDVNITNSKFFDNKGNFLVYDAKVTFTNVEITNNISNNYLFQVEKGSVSIYKSLIAENIAPYFERVKGSVIVDEETKIDYSQFTKGVFESEN